MELGPAHRAGERRSDARGRWTHSLPATSQVDLWPYEADLTTRRGQGVDGMKYRPPMSGVPRRARLTETLEAPPVTVLHARRPDLHVPAIARARRAGAGEVSDGSPCPPNGSMSSPGAGRHRRTRLRGAGWGRSSSATTMATELGSTRVGVAPTRPSGAGCRPRADGCPVSEEIMDGGVRDAGGRAQLRCVDARMGAQDGRRRRASPPASAEEMTLCGASGPVRVRRARTSVSSPTT
jgi:hypothetical protein